MESTSTALALAYTAGFVDTLGIIGLFAAHITGNFVPIATALAEMHHGLSMKLLAVPVFVAAAMAIQNAASRTFFSLCQARAAREAGADAARLYCRHALRHHRLYHRGLREPRRPDRHRQRLGGLRQILSTAGARLTCLFF